MGSYLTVSMIMRDEPITVADHTSSADPFVVLRVGNAGQQDIHIHVRAEHLEAWRSALAQAWDLLHAPALKVAA